MEEPSTSSGNRDSGKKVFLTDIEVFIEIAKNLQPNQFMFFGRVLGLTPNDLLNIQREADVHHLGPEAKVMQILDKWRQRVNPSEEELVPMLAKALNDIDRRDIADRIIKGGWLSRDPALQAVEVFLEIAKNLQPNQFHFLGIALGLTLNDLFKILREADVHHLGPEAEVMQILFKWRQRVNPSEEELVPMLAKALNDIDRKDIADRITKGGRLRRDPALEADNEVFKEIAKNLLPDQVMLFGIVLDLELNDLIKIQRDADVFYFGPEETVMQILEKWRQRVNPSEEQLVPMLVKALIDIERGDIADRITNGGRLKRNYALEVIVNKMQMRQRENFGHLLFPGTLWLWNKRIPLDEMFVELTMKKKNKTEELDEIVDRRKIFNEIEGKIPRRILIEGHSGFGKTTLIAKLLSDWSNELKKSQEKQPHTGRYISDKFDLVFVISLRNYKGELERHMIDQCEGIEGSQDDILNAIHEKGSKVLLLLDGLDEINKSFAETLFPILEKKKYWYMTVVVTCRTGFISSLVNSKQESKVKEFTQFQEQFVWDKRIQIKGFSSGKRLELLTKYLNVGVEELEENLLKQNLHLNDFYECPLFLMLLEVLIQEEKVEFPETKTELYKKVTNVLVNRSLHKENILGDQDEIDIFEMRNTKYRNLFINFGEMCFKKISDESLIFAESELHYSNEDKNIIKKFLSNRNAFFNLQEQEHYEPIHKSFLQFFASFYLSTLDEDKLLDVLMHCFHVKLFENQLLF